MNIQIETAQLQRALDTVSRAATSKIANNDDLGIFFSAHDDCLEIEATDYIIGIHVEVPATVMESGDTVIRAPYLIDLVKKFSAPSVTIHTDKEKVVTVSCGQSENDLVMGLAGEFPRLETLDQTQTAVLPSDQLKDMYQQTRFAVGGDNQRAIFTGILLEAQYRRARMVATDTHRLACRDVELEEAMARPVSLVIPEKVWADLIRLLPAEDSIPVTIHWFRSKVAFSFGNVYFVASLIEGEFPDYRRVFPATFQAKAVIDRKSLTAALERAALIARNMTYRTVTLKWSDNQLETSVVSAEYGSMEETIPCQYEGAPLDIVFNCFYLLDILKHSYGDTVTLHMLPNGPMLVEQEQDELYRYIVTPMRGN